MKRLLLAAFALMLGSLTSLPVRADDDASIVRGGRLYDHWSRELPETRSLDTDKR